MVGEKGNEMDDYGASPPLAIPELTPVGVQGAKAAAEDGKGGDGSYGARAGVLRLDDDELPNALVEYENLFLLVYDPYNLHMEEIRSTFEAMADELRREREDLVMCEIDGTRNVQCVQQYQISHFPAMLFFLNGQLANKKVGGSTGAVREFADAALLALTDADNAADRHAAQMLGQLLDPRVRMLCVEFDARTRAVNNQNVALAMFGIALAIVTNELIWSDVVSRDSATANVLKLFITISTAGLIFNLYRYYKLLLRIDHRRWKLPRVRTIFSRLGFKFLLEAVICAVHPFPWLVTDVGVDSGEHFDDRLALVMFVRLYLWARYFRDYSSVFRRRKDVLLAKYDDHTYSGDVQVSNFNWFLSVKTLFYTNSLTFVLCFVVVMPLVLAYCIFAAERDVQRGEFDLSSTLWYTVITMLTVGYGDISTTSHWGQVFSILAGAVGVILTALVITVVTQALTMSNSEKFASALARLRIVEKDERIEAANYIKFVWRFKRDVHKLSPVERSRAEVEFLNMRVNIVKRLKRLRRDRQSLRQETEFIDPVLNRLDAVTHDLKKVKAQLEHAVSAAKGSASHGAAPGAVVAFDGHEASVPTLDSGASDAAAATAAAAADSGGMLKASHGKRLSLSSSSLDSFDGGDPDFTPLGVDVAYKECQRLGANWTLRLPASTVHDALSLCGVFVVPGINTLAAVTSQLARMDCEGRVGVAYANSRKELTISLDADPGRASLTRHDMSIGRAIHQFIERGDTVPKRLLKQQQQQQ